MIPLYYGGGGAIKIIGKVTGTTYIFRQGTPQDVNSADADEFLGMVKQTVCCGGTGRIVTTKLFSVG